MKKILAIDDSEVNLFLIQAHFEDNNNFQVDIESNSTKAISRLKREKYDLLLLDLMMPVVDGFQILREMKKDNLLKNIPIIVISAKQDNETIQMVMDYGSNEYIKKPLNMTVLEEKVSNILIPTLKR